MAQKNYPTGDEDTVVARDTGDPNSKYKTYPSKPSAWDHVKEAFEPTGTRAMLDAVRKRKSGQS